MVSAVNDRLLVFFCLGNQLTECSWIYTVLLLVKLYRYITTSGCYMRFQIPFLNIYCINNPVLHPEAFDGFTKNEMWCFEEGRTVKTWYMMA